MIKTLDNAERMIMDKVERLINDGRLKEDLHVYPSLKQMLEVQFQVMRTAIYEKGCTCYTGPHVFEPDIHCIIHEQEGEVTPEQAEAVNKAVEEATK